MSIVETNSIFLKILIHFLHCYEQCHVCHIICISHPSWRYLFNFIMAYVWHALCYLHRKTVTAEMKRLNRVISHRALWASNAITCLLSLATMWTFWCKKDVEMWYLRLLPRILSEIVEHPNSFDCILRCDIYNFMTSTILKIIRPF